MSLNIAEHSPGVNRQGRIFSRLENPDESEKSKPPGGFVKAPNAVTAMPSLPDSAFRLWIALQEFSWRGAIPSNDQLARACGWVNDDAKGSTSKVKRWLRVLIDLGLADRRIETRNNRKVRTSLGPILTHERIESEPPVRSKSTHPIGSNTDRVPDRCRKKAEDLPRTGAGEKFLPTTTKIQNPSPPSQPLQEELGGTGSVLRPREAERCKHGVGVPNPCHPTDAQQRFLDELPADLRAVFDAESLRSQASILRRFELGPNADYAPIIRDTMAMLGNRLRLATSRPAPTSAWQEPKSLMEAASKGDHAATMHLAQRLVLDFGDAKSRRAFEKLGKELLLGQRSVDEVWHAYTKATGPQVKNRGAIFNVELRNFGPGGRPML